MSLPFTNLFIHFMDARGTASSTGISVLPRFPTSPTPTGPCKGAWVYMLRTQCTIASQARNIGLEESTSFFSKPALYPRGDITSSLKAAPSMQPWEIAQVKRSQGLTFLAYPKRTRRGHSGPWEIVSPSHIIMPGEKIGYLSFHMKWSRCTLPTGSPLGVSPFTTVFQGLECSYCGLSDDTR